MNLSIKELHEIPLKTLVKDEVIKSLFPPRRNLRLVLQRKCRERGYPFSNRLLEVANLIAPAFERK